MSDTKISALTSGDPAQINDQVPINRAGANFSITVGSISALGVLFASAGNIDTLNANSGTQSFATTYTIPANYLVTNKVLRIIFGFAITTSAATVPTVGFNVLIGGVKVYGSNPQLPTANWVASPISMSFIVQGSAAASGSAAVYTAPMVYSASNSTVNSPFAQAISGGATQQPVNLPTNSAMAIQIQYVTNNSQAGNRVTLQQVIVEALN